MKVFSAITTLLCFIILGAHLFHLVSVWELIPSSIFFMYSGDSPSQSGPKELLLLIPVLSIILWLFMYFLIFIRRKFNYINLTEENKESHYFAMAVMLYSLQILSFTALISLNESFLHDTLGIHSSLYENLAIVLFFACIIPPIVLAIWSRTSMHIK